MKASRYDVAIIGAGAAGMMAAAVAGQRGLRVVLIEHAQRLAEKIRISGGGRCNFTNTGVTHAQFISQNSNFCRSALSAYKPRDFLDLVERHGIRWHEKHRGQLFCDESSEDIIRMLRAECDDARVAWRMPCTVESIVRNETNFILSTNQGSIQAAQLVLATGGMAIPQLGATDFSLKIARQFGLKIIEPRPALVPLVFDAAQWQPFGVLSGVALEASVATGKGRDGGHFVEDLLLTHRGLSGPAILQISSYWNPGQPLSINLASERDIEQELLQAKHAGRQQLSTVLATILPRRLVDGWLGSQGMETLGNSRVAEIPDARLRQLAASLHGWSLVPTGTAGYKKAEVMRGGVDTRAIDQKSMQVRHVPGLYIIGEALDVTGWLGGYNFQWAWSSGVACGRALLAAS